MSSPDVTCYPSLRLVVRYRRQTITEESGISLKRIPPAPLLLIAAIVLDRLAISSTQIAMIEGLRSLVILLLAAASLMLVLHYFIRDWQRTGFIVLLVPIALVAYRSAFHFLKTSFSQQSSLLGILLTVLLGLVYAALVNGRVWRSVRRPARLMSYFNLVFGVLLLFQLVRLGQDHRRALIQTDDSAVSAIAATGDALRLKSGSSPDIYVIVLDGYARQDVLQAIYRYDNSPFIGQLKARGFAVARSSHSNYTQTPYSMASFWNLDYVQPWDSSSEFASYLYRPIQDNRVFRALDEIGYTTVSFQGAANFTEIRSADRYLSSFLPLNDFETLLLVDNPLEPLSDVFDLRLPLLTYKTHRQRTTYQLNMLKEVPAALPGPKIVYAHILVPHPPFVFRADGAVREPQQPYTLGEGFELQGSAQAYQAGYREQVTFINGEILRIVDAILARSATPPVILLMSDHGPASMFTWTAEDPGCLWERTGNFHALLLPGHENEAAAHPAISPVNTFRLIFNTYFGTDLPLLEDRSYLMYWYEPTLSLDITDARQTFDGCTISEEALVLRK